MLIALYSVRSERALCEHLDYPDKSGLFRWFLDMNLVERSFDPSVFNKSRRQPPAVFGLPFNSIIPLEVAN